MAKQPPTKGRDAHVRLIVLEATLPDGDISQLAQALQNALRPAQASVTRSLGSSGGAPQVAQIEGTVVEQEENVEEANGEEPFSPVRHTREPRPRKVSTPKAVDLQPDAKASWLEYAGSVEASKEIDRYLCVAAWAHDHNNDEPVTTGLVYTCYRLMKWPVGIDDFGKHLRAAKSQQYLSQVGRGEYRITQLGLHKVEELSKG